MSKVIIVGGGASGMMAAIAAADAGHKVTLLEKNEKLGKKLFITGKGRCNVTNAADMDVLFDNVCTNAKFLYSAFYQFDNKAVMNLLEKSGCPLKIERGDRVFPVSDHSSDVIAAFQRELKKRNVEVLLHTEVKRLLLEETVEEAVDENFDLPRCIGVELADHRKLPADACILCTGGISYPSTGSTGDGHRFAEETGHKLVECKPALVPLETAESWCRDLMGGIDPYNKVNEITREERKTFSELIKSLPLTVTGTRSFAEAIITQGGVSVKDVNPSTMESKKVKGLYFAGEVLDLDAMTGGFNLQIAWSTGYLAGSSVKEMC